MSADRSRTDSPGPLPQDKLLRLQTVFLGGLFTLGIFYTLYLAAEIFIPISLALLLNLLLAPAVLGLQRYRVPAPLGAAVILLLFLGTVIAAVFYLSEPAKTWIDRAPGSLRIVEYKVRAVVQTIEEVKKTTAEVEQMTNLDDGETEQSVVVKRESLTETLVSGTQRFAASAMITIVLLYFLLSTGDLFLRKVIRLSPTFKDKRKNVTIARQMEQEISRYLVTITAANCVLGGCLALALYLLGVPNPLLWGVAAALLNFIPYIGAMAMLGVLGFVSLLGRHFAAAGHFPGLDRARGSDPHPRAARAPLFPQPGLRVSRFDRLGLDLGCLRTLYGRSAAGFAQDHLRSCRFSGAACGVSQQPQRSP